MSVESDSGQEGSTKRQTSLTSTKDKMKVQQRMIDLTARELESTRLAMTPVTESGGTALEENNLLIEVSLIIANNGYIYIYKSMLLIHLFRIN